MSHETEVIYKKTKLKHLLFNNKIKKIDWRKKIYKLIFKSIKY